MATTWPWSFAISPLWKFIPMQGRRPKRQNMPAIRASIWQMHDAIFANQHRLSIQLLFAIAGTLQLSQIGLRDSIARELHADKIQADFIGGVRSGVNGTPTFFVNGLRHEGGFSVTELAASIQAAMAPAPVR